MIFATDLDRTLIYSHLFLEKADCEYELIEKKGDKPIAYMSKEAIRLLVRLHQKAHIVPISLRNEEEFHRIDLFRELVVPEIFVTNNGGTIYYHGKEDLKWSGYIKSRMQQLETDFEEAGAAFRKKYNGTIEKTVNCGNLVWLFLGERDRLDFEGIKAFEEEMTPSGWKIDASGRKIYVYPHFVTKWEAVKYIQKTYFNEPVVAAGDSVFDQEMVEKADYGIIPRSSFIEEKVLPHVKITRHSGMKAAEDILSEVIKRI